MKNRINIIIFSLIVVACIIFGAIIYKTRWPKHLQDKQESSMSVITSTIVSKSIEPIRAEKSLPPLRAKVLSRIHAPSEIPFIIRQFKGSTLFLTREKAILVNCGSEDNAVQLVSELKKILSDRKIDYLFLSSIDSVHLGGLAKIIENFDIGLCVHPYDIDSVDYWKNREEFRGDIEHQFRNNAIRYIKELEYKSIKFGTDIIIGDMVGQYTYPVRQLIDPFKLNNSGFLIIKYDVYRFMFCNADAYDAQNITYELFRAKFKNTVNIANNIFVFKTLDTYVNPIQLDKFINMMEGE